MDQAAQIFRVEPVRQRRRLDQITEHHRHLTQFTRLFERCLQRSRRLGAAQLAQLFDRCLQDATMSERQAEFLQIGIRQVNHRRKVDVVVFEAAGMDTQADRLQPVAEFVSRSAHLRISSMADRSAVR